MIPHEERTDTSYDDIRFEQVIVEEIGALLPWQLLAACDLSHCFPAGSLAHFAKRREFPKEGCRHAEYAFSRVFCPGSCGLCTSRCGAAAQ